MSSTLYRVRESFPDARSALERARAIMRESADWASLPTPRMKPVATAEQYAYALSAFETARIHGNRAESGVGLWLDEVRSRTVVTFDNDKPDAWFAGHVRLRPGLGDLWPLPERLTLTLDSTAPFGDPGSEPDPDSTEEELDDMVSVLGPLSLDVDWDCGWRGLSEVKDCGVQLCLNSVWTQQIAVPSPGEFGVWISLGNRVARTAEGEHWRRDCGLSLGEPQPGW
ncbi:hypothetical protein PV682_11410 [Streptomyces niveiscabiei]|uniref:hypothetical protein n=1 Tax=Streptomyces niveiscabiei TaxID=164115 RepID=UPI0029A9EA3B|nr:hypothetical protein [Streptomyces niveiscabiei]MDX3382059.1 hypothetical protein [Streptomyces niveiscabiei]